jgi:pimeloyl-ACP methyl ester carboxylesterase
MQTETTAAAGEDSFRHKYIDSGTVRLHLAEAGPEKAPLVVLLHGFPEFWWSWRHQLRALADAGFLAVAPDMRGYNLSDKPREVKAYEIEHLTADVAAIIRSYGRSRAVVVGHDWGGGVAWQFAMSYPQMVERLVLLNCPHPERLIQALRTREQMKKSWYMFFFQLPFLPERVFARNDFAMMRRTFKKDGFSAEEIAPYVEAMSKEGAVRGAINYYRAAMRRAITDRPSFPRIDAPTLVIWGEKDQYISRDLASPGPDRAPNARVERIADATHWVQHDAPDRVNELLIELIADLKTSSRPS